MKKLNYAICILVLIICLSATKESVVKQDNPYGTIWLKDNIYIDVAPVCNVHYREYEYYNRHIIKYNLSEFEKFVDTLPYYGYNLKEFKELISFTPNPDSILFKIDANSEVTWNHYPSYMNYLKNQKFNYYPVINISQEVAEAYCRWRTKMVMLYYSAISTNKKRAKSHKKIRYSLATQAEWEYALKSLPIKYPNPNSNVNSFETFLLNEEIYQRKMFCLTNFSEMVAEKNIAKGRNWKDSSTINNPNATCHYNVPTDWLTFRCVCEVED